MVCNRHNIHQEALLQITRSFESLAGTFLRNFPISLFALKRGPLGGWGADVFLSLGGSAASRRCTV